MIEGEKNQPCYQDHQKKSFSNGIITPTKMKFSNERSEKSVVIGVIFKSLKIKNSKLT